MTWSWIYRFSQNLVHITLVRFVAKTVDFLFQCLNSCSLLTWYLQYFILLLVAFPKIILLMRNFCSIPVSNAQNIGQRCTKKRNHNRVNDVAIVAADLLGCTIIHFVLLMDFNCISYAKEVVCVWDLLSQVCYECVVHVHCETEHAFNAHFHVWTVMNVIKVFHVKRTVRVMPALCVKDFIEKLAIIKHNRSSYNP